MQTKNIYPDFEQCLDLIDIRVQIHHMKLELTVTVYPLNSTEGT
jgi:hypothetical protein